LRFNNQTTPAGNVRIGDYNYLTPTNTTIKSIKDFEKIPLYKGGVQSLYLGDVATVEDGGRCYGRLCPGELAKRSVYLNIASLRMRQPGRWFKI